MSNKTLQFDAIIIGSGQGGTPLAVRLAKEGGHVALVESEHLGGTCVNTGCTPTKTMVASAQVAYYAREAVRWGVQAGPVTVDLPAILRRKDAVVGKSRSGWEHSVDGKGQPKLYRGRARFVGVKTIEVNGETLRGDRIFIDTGSAPAVPDIEGLGTVPYLTNVSLLELEQIPEHLIILGGGYVGLEFAQMFRRFGSAITVVQSAGQILTEEDADIAEALQKALEAEDIQFVLQGRATKAERQAGAIQLSVQHAAGQVELVRGSHLLVAAGRNPQTKELDLTNTGVKTTERGFIQVNERLETTAEDIWAIGDVTGGPAFTHISYNDYQIIYGNLYEGKQLSTRERLVPYAVFTDPTLGRVGVTEKRARAEGRKLKIGTLEMTHVARAIERAETQGLMKLVVDAETDKVLGAAILASEGGELVQILSTLMLAGQPYTLLKGAIYIHPTLAEGFFGLMDSVKPVD